MGSCPDIDIDPNRQETRRKLFLRFGIVVQCTMNFIYVQLHMDNFRKKMCLGWRKSTSPFYGKIIFHLHRVLST